MFNNSVIARIFDVLLAGMVILIERIERIERIEHKALSMTI
ncbi:hypothetical protein [Shewanella sp. SM95]|nr:hypothetical protein [Shewanella sp. SM95]